MTDRLPPTRDRVDDLPLLRAQMHRMGVPQVRDQPVTVHGHRQGRAFGWTTVLWLAHVRPQADPRMKQGQPWAARRLTPLRRCSGQDVPVVDWTADRLAAVRRTLRDAAQWTAFERVLTHPLGRG